MRITVSGYASLDYPMLVEGLPVPDRTSTVLRRLGSVWPSPGGAAYVARAARRAWSDVALATWLGWDTGGDAYVDHLRQAAIDTRAVERTGPRSPSSYLFYDHQGHAACCFDPGTPSYELTPAQHQVLRTSDWWALAVGPPSVSETVLAALPDDRRLAWIIKADASAFPPQLATRLLRRADLITLSIGERSFLAAQAGRDDPLALARPDALVIETAGAQGVWFRGPESEGHVPVDSLSSTDTTGAGDTLAGTAVGALAAGGNPRSAVQEGIAAATDFLATRIAQENAR